jgi:hypothetical protein
LLLDAFKALQVQESLFRSVLKKFTNNWVPTKKEERIIQAAWHGCYPDHIEGAFFNYGGLKGIIALAIAFRDTDSIVNQWTAIKDEASRKWLVENVVHLMRDKENEWMKGFIPQSTPSL